LRHTSISGASCHRSQALRELGFDVGGGTTEQLAEFGRSERRKWGPLIAASGIKAE
jgi:hypothetical protein